MSNENQQRTVAWYGQRLGKITGSRAGAILGLSPWQKPADVLRAMVREYHGAPDEFGSNPATEWGNAHETEALLAFQRATGIDVQECGFFAFEEFLGASPDGLVGDDAVIEIKVPYSMRDKPASAFKSINEQPHYYAQLQMEMRATGRKRAYFFQYAAAHGDVFSAEYLQPRHRLEIVEICHEWWAQCRLTFLEFHTLYLAELDNPAHLEPLRVDLSDNMKARSICERVSEIRQAIENLTAEQDALVADLVHLSGEKNAQIGGMKLTLIERQGSISYSKAMKDLAPGADLEKWRGKASKSWRLS